MRNINYKQDGNKVCATFDDFINLQESQAGFWDNNEEARADLLKKPLLLEIEEGINKINDTFGLIEDWEISAIQAYKHFKQFDWTIKNALKLIESQTRDMVEDSPLEYKEFRISARKTYDFKSSPYYMGKVAELKIEENKEALKEAEKLIKTATDMDKTLFDESWEAIEKVEVSMKQILTYTPSKKK